MPNHSSPLRRGRRLSVAAHLACVTIAFLILTTVLPLTAQEAGIAGETRLDAQIRTVLSTLEERRGEDYWATLQRLETLGEDALPVVSRSMSEVGERGRLGCAKMLLDLGELDDGDRAVLVLEELLRTAKDKEIRIAAVRLLSIHAEPSEFQPQLEKLFETTKDPALMIPIAKALWDIDRTERAREKLVALLKVRQPKVKREAALTLAEMNYFEGEVREILRHLREEPSVQGRRAARLDDIQKLTRQLDRRLEDGDLLVDGVDLKKLVKIKDARISKLKEELDALRAPIRDGGGDGESRKLATDPLMLLLEEVIDTVQKSYVDAEKTNRKRLVKSAIKGMVANLDKFSSFMDVEATKQFHESMSGEYFGIGAHVIKKPDHPLEIRKILYDGPAHRAGVLSGDQVTKIDDVELRHLERAKVVGKLKGEAGTKITLTIKRPREPELLEVTVVRGRVEIPITHHDLLPGKVGYLKLTKFGNRAVADFRAAVDTLEQRGMVGLIIDLRDNPGGRRDSAVKIVDEFIGEHDLPILIQKGRGEEEIVTSPKADERAHYPIVVLVNSGSASASEIVAGALQDYERATIVGKQTFGKGSVQRVIQLSKGANTILGGEGRLRLTVQYYFLPRGRCVHTITDEYGNVVEQGGITPDLVVDAREIPVWRLEAMDKLQTDETVRTYVAEHFEALKGLYGTNDGQDPTKYPQLEALRETVETVAPIDDVRAVVRYLLRYRLEDEAGRDFACDYLTDAQLQKAIVHLLAESDTDAATIPEYSSFKGPPKQKGE